MSEEETRDQREQEYPPDSDERLAGFEVEDEDIEEDLATEQIYDTQHGEGHTYNPHQADDQGLTYTPPTDPPIMQVDEDPRGVEVTAGFSPSMEETDPSREELPPQVDNNDVDVQQDVERALRYNSETMHLTDVHVQVERGVVTLTGTVPTMDDIGLVYEIVYAMDGVVDVHSELETEF